MKMQLDLSSKNPKSLAEFYANTLGLYIEEKPILNFINYSCTDSYGNGFYISPIMSIEKETTTMRVTIKIANPLEKQKELYQKGIKLKWANSDDSFFSFNDPQGNEIVIMKE